MAEEERLSALRDEAEWVWHLEREQEKRDKEERELTRKRNVAESQRIFKRQVRVYTHNIRFGFFICTKFIH